MAKETYNKTISRPLADLHFHPANPRDHSEESIRRLADSIKEDPTYFEAHPILLSDRTGELVIIGGEGRCRAARFLGMTEAPTFLFEGLTEEDEVRIMQKDNSHTGKWDEAKLRELVKDWGGAKVVTWTPGVQWSISKVTGKDRIKGLRAQYIVPPFSVFDTRRGEWQERARMWKEKIENRSLSRENTISKGFSFWGGGGTSDFDPVLAEVMYSWFCPDGGTILDPFAGEPTKGYIAGANGYKYIGIDIRKEQVSIDKKVCSAFDGVGFVVGDSGEIEKYVERKNRGFDFCLTSPPYYNLENYGGGAKDASTFKSYQEFDKFMGRMILGVFRLLADDAFFVIKVANVRDNNGDVLPFVSDTIRNAIGAGFSLYNSAILLNALGSAPVRANGPFRTRKLTSVHQNVLVFYKGEIKRIMGKLNAEGSGRTLVADAEKIYNFCAENEKLNGHIYDIDSGLKTFLSTVGNIDITNGIVRDNIIISDNAPDDVLLAYTGGKDSTVAAIVLRNSGLNVRPIFIRGLNKSFPQEEEQAKKICEILGLQLEIKEYKQEVKNIRPDNPVKNQLILAILADMAVERGVRKISSGVIPVNDANLDYDWSDSSSLMNAYVDYIERSVPGLKYIDALTGRNEADNIATIIKDYPKVFNLLSSCVGPLRYRAQWRKQISEKYGIDLPENMCGRCFKCCYTYIVQASITKDFSKEYLAYCFEKLFRDSDTMHTTAKGDAETIIRVNFGETYWEDIYALYQRISGR